MADEEPDVESTIAAWTAGQRRCRSRRQHTWRPFTVIHHTGVGGHYLEVIERCIDCLNRHARDLDMAGWWMEPRWRMLRYNPGYLLPKGSGGLTGQQVADLRLEDILGRKIIEVTDE